MDDNSAAQYEPPPGDENPYRSPRQISQSDQEVSKRRSLVNLVTHIVVYVHFASLVIGFPAVMYHIDAWPLPYVVKEISRFSLNIAFICHFVGPIFAIANIWPRKLRPTSARLLALAEFGLTAMTVLLLSQ